MKIKERSIGLSILFCILTCGAYSLFWLYSIINDIYNITEDEKNPGLEIILCAVTCNIYTVFLWNKLGKSLQRIREVENFSYKNCSTTFTILAVLGYFVGGISAIFRLITTIPPEIMGEELYTFFVIISFVVSLISIFSGIFIFVLLSLSQSYLNEMSNVEFARSTDANQI